jgi:hypothetical protein
MKRGLNTSKIKFSKKDINFEGVPFRNTIALVISLNVLTFFVLALLFGKLPPMIPLLYGFPRSELQLAANYAIFLPNSIAVIITFINFGLSLLLKSDYQKKVLLFASLTISALASITALRIALLVLIN